MSLYPRWQQCLVNQSKVTERHLGEADDAMLGNCTCFIYYKFTVTVTDVDLILLRYAIDIGMKVVTISSCMNND